MTASPRRIDHAVVAVHDLDAAGAFYGSLGFRVGARNRHPWGTENRLIQFGSSFIELIALGPDAGAIPDHARGRFSFGAFVRDFLREREGPAMLVLDSDDAEADAALFAREGIGSFEPFFFERKGRRPDGGEAGVAFTLAFAVDPRSPGAGFFVCQQHAPESFWNPAFQDHPNGAGDVAALGLIAPDPPAHEAFLAAFSGGTASRRASGALSFALAQGRLDVSADPSGPASPPGLRLRSVAVRLPALGGQIARLRAEGIPFVPGDGSLAVPAEAAFGTGIVFEAPAGR